MLIIVAGPYSAETEEQRRRNLDAMEEAAARVLERGHIPVIGVNAALPIVERARVEDRYEALMAISLALAERCDAILLIGESPGANRERDALARLGRPVYRAVEEIPG